MARFCVTNGLKIMWLVLGLTGLVGCTRLPGLLAAPVVVTSEPTPTVTIPPLPTRTRKPTLSASPTATARPTPLATATVPATTSTPAYPIGQHPYSVTLSIVDADGFTGTVDVNYLLYLPRDYGRDTNRKWPMIVFLHGASERGTDPMDITRYSIPAFLTTTPDFPFVVLSPQSPPDAWWSGEVDVLDALLNYIQTTYAIDPKRIDLTGQSMGGFGTWAMALRYPKRFAAIVPVASGYDVTADLVPPNICDLKDTPIWVFHGALDESILPDQVTAMVDALRDCGGNVRFTLYPDADHLGSSNRAYADPELYTWLLQQTLK
jgi:dipeptidyl aminopeptidase/acylaminoacyl peptidase